MGDTLTTRDNTKIENPFGSCKRTMEINKHLKPRVSSRYAHLSFITSIFKKEQK